MTEQSGEGMGASGTSGSLQQGSVQRPFTFFCITFGCKVNQYETQAIREAWTKAGGTEADAPSHADLVLVNSCAITGRAERDARNALVRLRHEAPQAVLVLTGCAARLVAGFVPRANAPRPEADNIIVQESKQDLVQPSVLANLLAACPEPGTSSASGACPPPAMQRHDLLNRPWPAMQIEQYKRSRPVLKVQDGCSHRCTYCIVPLTRGPHVSRPPETVVAEARRLLENHAEIMISGVNLGQYGRDHPEYGTFWDLLARLEEELGPEFSGRRRLRISSLEPSQLTEKACSFLARSSLVAPHLHISLQHASSNVLKRMGRGHYSSATLTEAVARLSPAWPLMGLGADILVGFPGETAEDVDELLRFVEETPFTYAHVFPYSRRPGTPAASFSGQLPKKEKQARAAAVRSVVAHRAKNFWAGQAVCSSFRLVLDAAEGNVVAGYVHGVNEYYAPCYLPSGELAQLDPEAGHKDFITVRPLGLCDKGILVSARKA